MWNYPQDSLPADGDTVWVTRLPYFDKPFQATYSAAAAVFVWTNPDGFDVWIPIWQVWNWRPV